MIRFFQYILLIMLAGSTFVTNAQDYTKGMQEPTLSGQPKAKILLIPYEGKMLLSDINRELGSEHDMSLPEIKSLFRESLCQIVAMEGSEKYELIDMINSGDQVIYQDLQYIFNTLGYSYEKVPPPPVEEEEKNLLEKMADKVEEKNNPDQKGRGTYVAEGEIRSRYDDKERYMEAKLMNPLVVEYLVEQYEADYLFFITQLDIKVLRTPEMPEWTTAERMVKMHYTILDRSGEKVAGSAAYSYFGPEEKNIFNIIKQNFPLLANQALESIPSDEPEEEKEENENPDKEAEEAKTTRSTDEDDDF